LSQWKCPEVFQEALLRPIITSRLRAIKFHLSQSTNVESLRVAASMLLIRPEILREAILFRAMVLMQLK